MSVKKDDAALLAQGTDENADRRETNRKGETVLKWNGYNIAVMRNTM